MLQSWQQSIPYGVALTLHKQCASWASAYQQLRDQKFQNLSIKQLVSMLRQLAEALLLLVHLLKLWSELVDLLLVQVIFGLTSSRLEFELIGPLPRLQWSLNVGRAIYFYFLSTFPAFQWGSEAAEQCQVVQLRTETFVRCFTTTQGRWLSTCLWNSESWQQWADTKSRR